jgi:hypothetical protein
MVVEPIVENKIIYIPVAEATAGGTPYPSKRGLKIAPPLKPKQPEAHPPTKAVTTRDLTVFLWNLISLAISPFPTLVLRACSAIIRFTATKDTAIQITMNKENRIQSTGPQCSIEGMIDLFDLLPLSKEINN